MMFPEQQQADAGTHLSTFDRSRIACGDWQPDEKAAQHLQGCAQCSEQVAAETADVRAMAYVPVPADILALARKQASQKEVKQSPIVWKSVLVAGVLALTSLVVVTTRPEPLTVRLKGSNGVAISVMRGDKLVVNDDAVEHPVDLRAGDQVQLHLLQPHVAWVIVQVGDERGSKEVYFAGPPPVDGLLPFAMTIDESPHVNVHLWTCERAPVGSPEDAVASGICKTETFTIGR